MSEDAKNKPDCYDFNANVVKSGKFDDTDVDMHSVQLTGVLANVRALIDGVACRTRRQQLLLWRMFYLPMQVVDVCQMWRIARGLEAMRAEQEQYWSGLVSTATVPRAFVVRDPALHRFDLDEAQDAKRDLDELEKSMLRLRETFPRLADRSLVAIRRTRDIQCSFIPQLHPPFDEDMIKSAQQHRAAGTLMDAETFVNGLQRN